MTCRLSMYRLKQNGLEPKSIDRPEPGYYELEWKIDGIKTYKPVVIWFGPPLDPETNEELDRSPRLQCRVNGQDADCYEIWPNCCARPITESDYISMLKELANE